MVSCTRSRQTAEGTNRKYFLVFERKEPATLVVIARVLDRMDLDQTYVFKPWHLKMSISGERLSTSMS